MAELHINIHLSAPLSHIESVESRGPGGVPLIMRVVSAIAHICIPASSSQQVPTSLVGQATEVLPFTLTQELTPFTPVPEPYTPDAESHIDTAAIEVAESPEIESDTQIDAVPAERSQATPTIHRDHVYRPY